MPPQHPATIDEILTAQQHAQTAAEANQHLTSCPYRSAGPDDAKNRFLQLVWARAYRETQALIRRQSTTSGAPQDTAAAD